MAAPPQVLPLWFNPLGPPTTNLLFFAVETSATLSCQTAESRCSFIESFFDQVEGGGGGDMNIKATQQQAQGSSIWTVGKLHSSGST